MRWSLAREYVVPASVAIVLVLQGCRGEQTESASKNQKPAGSPTTRPASRTKAPTKSRKVLVPLNLNIPKEIFCCLIYPWFEEPNVEEFSRKSLHERPAFMVPRGTENLAAHRPVTSNESLPIMGDLEMVSDRDIRGEDGYQVDIGFGLKWIQIDLEQSAPIYAIVVWHNWRQGQFYSIYRDVIVQVSDDPEFKRNVRTLFNNDHDNSSELGRGKDKGYLASRYGKIIDAGGVRARYIRLYSNGSTNSDYNQYSEVAVYGLGMAKSPPRTGLLKLPSGWRPESLCQAVWAGDTVAAEKFLRQGKSLNGLCWPNKETLLHKASRRGHDDVARLLLVHRVNPDIQDSLGRTPLHIAAYSKDIPLVQMLLKYDARVDIKDRKQAQALQGAVECPAVVRLLLEYGSEVNAQDAGGRIALCRAAFMGNTETVDILLANGADVNHATLRGETPLHWAAEGGYATTVRKLLAAGALVNAKSSYGLTPLDHAVNGGYRCSAEFLRRSGGKAGRDIKTELGDTKKR